VSVKVSIITVCLNAADALAVTCESILNQRYTSFEWIVIDGASTDGSLRLLEQCKERISHLVSEPDKGIYDAMNKGVGLAKGDYLLFLNAGDELAGADVLGALHGVPEAEIIYGDIKVVSCDASSVLKTPKELPEGFLLRNMMPHQSTFIKRELFEKYGAYDTSFKIAADYEFFVRTLHVHRVSSSYCEEVISVFHTGGVSNDPKWKSVRKLENHRIRKKYFWKYFFSWRYLRTELKLLFKG